jgi:threonine dehydratase
VKISRASSLEVADAARLIQNTRPAQVRPFSLTFKEDLMDIAAEVYRAAGRIYDVVRETPLDLLTGFSDEDLKVYGKLENLQHTGSFKLRGAVNKLMSLNADQKEAGCVTASTGNHGAAMAYAYARLGIKGMIFVPENAASTKVESIRRYGGDLKFHGVDGAQTERYAREFADSNGMLYVSPYNDPGIIGGQGTVGLEMYRQRPDLDAVFVSVGGGGLMSGIAGLLKSVNPGIWIVGCQPANSAVMAHSIAAGRVIDEESLPTLSDGTAGGMDLDSITFAPCRDYVDEWILVDEDEIAASMRKFMQSQHQLIEGSAGVALAGIERVRSDLAGKQVGAVICGANLSLDTLKTIL